MSSATLTSPPTATARLVIDTDVASFVFKWHPEFAPRYVGLIRGSELVVSFMTLAETWKRIWPTSQPCIPTEPVAHLDRSQAMHVNLLALSVYYAPYRTPSQARSLDPARRPVLRREIYGNAE